jgi:hypothetical protein
MRAMTVTSPESKLLGKQKFKETEHPRDRKGRFIEVNAKVSIFGGSTGTVVGNLGNGRIEVLRDGDNRKIIVHRNYLTVTARPDGSAPTDKTKDKPQPAKPTTASPDALPEPGLDTTDDDPTSALIAGTQDMLDQAAAGPQPPAAAPAKPAVTRGGLDANGNRLPDSDGVIRLTGDDKTSIGGPAAPQALPQPSPADDLIDDPYPTAEAALDDAIASDRYEVERAAAARAAALLTEGDYDGALGALSVAETSDPRGPLPSVVQARLALVSLSREDEGDDPADALTTPDGTVGGPQAPEKVGVDVSAKRLVPLVRRFGQNAAEVEAAGYVFDVDEPSKLKVGDVAIVYSRGQYRQGVVTKVGKTNAEVTYTTEGNVTQSQKIMDGRRATIANIDKHVADAGKTAGSNWDYYQREAEKPGAKPSYYSDEQWEKSKQSARERFEALPPREEYVASAEANARERIEGYKTGDPLDLVENTSKTAKFTEIARPTEKARLPEGEHPTSIGGESLPVAKGRERVNAADLKEGMEIVYPPAKNRGWTPIDGEGNPDWQAAKVVRGTVADVTPVVTQSAGGYRRRGKQIQQFDVTFDDGVTVRMYGNDRPEVVDPNETETPEEKARRAADEAMVRAGIDPARFEVTGGGLYKTSLNRLKPSDVIYTHNDGEAVMLPKVPSGGNGTLPSYGKTPRTVQSVEYGGARGRMVVHFTDGTHTPFDTDFETIDAYNQRTVVYAVPNATPEKLRVLLTDVTGTRNDDGSYTVTTAEGDVLVVAGPGAEDPQRVLGMTNKQGDEIGTRSRPAWQATSKGVIVARAADPDAPGRTPGSSEAGYRLTDEAYAAAFPDPATTTEPPAVAPESDAPKPVLKGEALKADLLSRAEAFPEGDKRRTSLTSLAARTGLVDVEGTALVVAKGDRGEGFRIYHKGTGLHMGYPGSNFANAADATEVAKRWGALRNEQGSPAFVDSGDTSAITGWKSPDGVPLADVINDTRAAFDDEKGLTGTLAQDRREQRRLAGEQRAVQAEADKPLIEAGYSLATSTASVAPGSDVVVQPANGPEVRGRLIDHQGQGARHEFIVLTDDGKRERVNVLDLDRRTNARVFAKPNTAPMEGWEDHGDGVYVKPLYHSGTTTTDGSGLVIADGAWLGYIGPSRSGEGFDFTRTESRDRSPSYPTRTAAARALAGRNGDGPLTPTVVAPEPVTPPPAPEPDPTAPVDRYDMNNPDTIESVLAVLPADQWDETFSSLVADVRDVEETFNTPSTGTDDPGNAAWANLDDTLAALQARSGPDDAPDVEAVRDALVTRGREQGYEVFDSARRMRRERLKTADVEALRAEFNALPARDYDAREDFEAEFERRGLDSDGNDPPAPNPDAADRVDETVGLLDDLDTPEARQMRADAEAYSNAIREDANDARAIALAADLDASIEALARSVEAQDDPTIAGLAEAVRGTILPPHRTGLEVDPNQLTFDDLPNEPTPTPTAATEQVSPTDLRNGDAIMLDGRRYEVRGAGSGRGNSTNVVLLDNEAYQADIQDEERRRRAGEEVDRTIRSPRDRGHETTRNFRNDETVQRIVADEPTVKPVEPTVTEPDATVPAPPKVTLTDSTFGDLAVGDRFVDGDGEAVVLSTETRGSTVDLDVRRPTGVESIRADRSEVVQRVTAEQAANLPSMVPAPPPLPATTPRSRPSLRTYQRNMLLGYGLDSDPAESDLVRSGFARLRARQPLSDAESRAVADALGRLADGAEPRRAAALRRAQGQMVIAADSASISSAARGTGRRKPPNASLIRRLTAGTRVRIPAGGGYPETEGKVVSIRQEGRTSVRTFTIETGDGQTVTRSLLGGAYVETVPGPEREPVQDRVAVGDLKPGDRVQFSDGNAYTIVGVRDVEDDPNGVVLVDYTAAGSDEKQTLPFGKAVQVDRLYGPDAAVPDPEAEETEPQGSRVGKASEIAVGDLITGTFTDTGNHYIVRVREVTPILGGTSFRVIGEDHQGRDMVATYEGGEEVVFLPPLPEDKPVPTPPKVEPVATTRHTLKPGDRVTIPNPVTGRDVSGVIEYVDHDPEGGEDEEGNPIPATIIGVFNGFSTSSYHLTGDDVVHVNGNAGPTYVQDRVRERQIDMIASTLHGEAERTQETMLRLVVAKVRMATSERMMPEIAHFESDRTAPLQRLRENRDMFILQAVKGGMAGNSLTASVDALVGSGADDALKADTRARLSALHQQAAEMAFDKAFAGLEEAKIDEIDPRSDGGGYRIERLLKMVEPNRGYDSYDEEIEQGRERLGTMTDLGPELRLLASTAPILGNDRPTGVDPERPDPPAPDNRPLAERLADYKAALPAVFGSAEVERTSYVGDFDLAALRRGEVPATAKTRMTVTEKATDGGPTEETMRQLEVLKAAGREVSIEVDRRLRRILDGEGADEIEKVRAEAETLRDRISVLGNEHRDRLLSERTNGAETSFQALGDRQRAFRLGESEERVPEETMNVYRQVAFETTEDPEYAALQREYAEVQSRLSALEQANPNRLTTEADVTRSYAALKVTRDQREVVEAEEIDKAIVRLSGGKFANREEAVAAQDKGDRDVMETNLLGRARQEARQTPEFQAAEKAIQDAHQTYFDLKIKQAESAKRLKTARARATAQVIAEFREIGPRSGEQMRYTGLTERAESVKALRWAEQHYPADWMERASKITLKVKARGGQYSTSTRTIELGVDATEEVEGAGKVGRVAIHELGHHMEQYVPGVKNAEQAFLWSRTTVSGEVGSRVRERQVSLGYGGRRRSDVAHKDEFNEHYSGREYRWGDYEVLTTAMEDVFAGSFTGTIYGKAGQNVDEDYRAWLHGVLTLL